MKKSIIFLQSFWLFFFALTCIFANISSSAFSIKGNERLILATNFNTRIDFDGFVFVNQRGVLKKGRYPNAAGEHASWVSKWGSITLTYYCPGLPRYGMNEQGLVVSCVRLPQEIDNETDLRLTLDGNSWVQYILDNCSSVNDVIEINNELKILNNQDHYLICDRFGNNIVVEFTNGDIVYYQNNSLPISLLTEAPYEECLEFSKNIHPQKKGVLNPFGQFQKNKQLLDEISQKTIKNIDQYFEILNKFNPYYDVQWNIVFDLTNLRIYYQLNDTNQIRYFDINRFDFSCSSKILSLNIKNEYAWNVESRFKPYSKIEKENILFDSFGNFGIRKTLDEATEMINFYTRFKCEY